MTTTHSLDGSWRLLPVDAFRQGFYPLDDDAWVEQQLPAHWQQHPLFERYAGRMVYRKRFQAQDIGSQIVAQHSAPGTRYWLRLNGTFYWSQAYFNGVDLGRHEGYFTPQEHDVTLWVAEQNTLVVEVECPDEHDKFGKRLITGVFSHWDCIDPHTNPGGIWLPVELITSGPTRIKQVRVQSEHIADAAAELRYHVALDAAAQADATLRWTLTPKNFAGEVQVIEQRRALAEGAQEITGVLTVRDPQLWWTHDLGNPNCYTATLDVVQDSATSDTHSFTFGIRQFELRDWIAYLNGVRVFIKGNNYAPGDVRIATMTAEACQRDLRLARECHMNMLRVHAHVDHPAFYEAADEAGILIWQDFPLQWLYQRAILPIAQQQVREMVQLLFNHPSIAVWCMHNEPLYNADTKDERITTWLRTYASVFIWNWNRDVMDTQLKQEVERLDATRPAVRSSGEYPLPLYAKGTDTHFYFGWYYIYGVLRTWDTLLRYVPDAARFVTEFGAQSFPNLESSVKFMDADIAKIDWPHVVERHMFQDHIMEHWYNWRDSPTLAALIERTQDYQSMVNRFYIDRLRYHKYHPTGGVVPFMFHDPNPAVLWSILDYWRVPKKSYYAMQLAFSPQYVFALIESDQYVCDEPVDLPIYIVNDAHHDVSAQVAARLLDATGTELAHVARSLMLPSDCMAIEVERLRLTPTAPGTYRLALALVPEGGTPIEHAYEIVVAVPATKIG